MQLWGLGVEVCSNNDLELVYGKVSLFFLIFDKYMHILKLFILSNLSHNYNSDLTIIFAEFVNIQGQDKMLTLVQGH